MDQITSFALTLTLAAVGFYALYWTVRKAVASGIRDARVTSQRMQEEDGEARPHR